jgi:hypothetical protein
MFPTQEVSLDNLKSSDNEISITGKSFLFDFTLGDFPTSDGKLTEISGIEGGVSIKTQKGIEITPEDMKNGTVRIYLANC